MNVRTAALLAAWASVAVRAAPAIAQGPPAPSTGHVELEVKGCPAVPTDAVRRVVSIEIGDLLVGTADADGQDIDRLTIRCAGNFAFVEATGSSGGPPIERIVRVDDFPGDAAPRALALLGVELLAARSAAVRARILRPQKAFPPAGGTVVASLPSPVAEHQVRIGAAVVWRTFVTRDSPAAVGGRVQASTTAMTHSLISGDLELVGARKSVYNVGQTAAWFLSAGATFGKFAGRDRWRAAVVVGGRIGLVYESGISAEPARISGSTSVRPWGGPILSASLSRKVGPVALTISGEAGWSLSSIDEMAAGATTISVGGPWLAVSIGADLQH